ncbi:MAG: hypothetical protein Q7Q73_07415 [Verrucomicrobiota bacterium JB024]|nr:hypothetical protein [Verrucomicrobiota bacterium JB024]
MKKPTKTDFERLVSDGVVKIALTHEQQARYEQAVKTQRRVNMGLFYRQAWPKEFHAEYQKFIKNFGEKNIGGLKKINVPRKKRGRPVLPDGEKKCERIEAKVTRVDKLKVMYAAQRAGKSESQFVKEAALREAGLAIYDANHP